MSNIVLSFDTLQYSKKLREAGFTEQQAEVQAEALRELIDDKLATKMDILELKKDIKASEDRLNNKINELSYKLTIRLGGMIVAGIVVLGVLFKF